MEHDRQALRSFVGAGIHVRRISVFLVTASALSVSLTGCATQSIDAVVEFIDAARSGDTAAIEHLTRHDFPQEGLAMVAAYALEDCTWEVAEASSDQVYGTFACPDDGLLESQDLVFTLDGARISAVEKSTHPPRP
jgi:hypothetical protein